MQDSEWRKIRAATDKFSDGEELWVVTKSNRRHWLHSNGGFTENLLHATTLTEGEANEFVKKYGAKSIAMALSEAMRTNWRDKLCTASKRTVAYRLAMRE